MPAAKPLTTNGRSAGRPKKTTKSPAKKAVAKKSARRGVRSAGGSIRADEALPIAVFMQRTGYGRRKVAAMQEQGLNIIRDGNSLTILGADYLDYLKKLSQSESAAQA